MAEREQHKRWRPALRNTRQASKDFARRLDSGFEVGILSAEFLKFKKHAVASMYIVFVAAPLAGHGVPLAQAGHSPR